MTGAGTLTEWSGCGSLRQDPQDVARARQCEQLAQLACIRHARLCDGHLRRVAPVACAPWVILTRWWCWSMGGSADEARRALAAHGWDLKAALRARLTQQLPTHPVYHYERTTIDGMAARDGSSSPGGGDGKESN